MGKNMSHRASLKMGAIIRKKSKAKRQKMAKEARTKQYPKRSKKLLIAPKALPNREEVQQQVHDTTTFINEVIRPIVSSKPIKDGGNYDVQLEEIRKQIIEQHKINVEKAQQSYGSLIDGIGKADAVIEVLDARDPVSCQFQNAEGEVTGANKPLIIVLNKIDLVPREVVTHWLAYYAEVAPAVAISAIDPNAPQALAATIARAAPNAQTIAIIGGHGVGKTKILEFYPDRFFEIESYCFVAHTKYAALLNISEWIDPIKDLAMATVERTNGEGIFTIMGVPPTQDSEEFLYKLAEKTGIKQKEAATHFINGICESRIHWYATPGEEEASNLSNEQLLALEASTPYELLGFEFITLNKGKPLKIDEALLGVDENEEEEENGDEEENNE